MTTPAHAQAGVDRPILFSGPMVRALIAGRKTQTRRIIKPQPIVDLNGSWRWEGRNGGFVGAMGTHVEEGFPETARQWTRIQPGERLWVRESLKRSPHLWVYSADGAEVGWPARGSLATKPLDYAPSIHMPRTASRLTLTVTDVRVQRLQDISEDDAIAEGVETERCCNVPTDACGTHLGGCCGQPEAVEPIDAYRNLWDEINGAGAWDRNDWVAAYTFIVERRNIDASPISREGAGQP